MKIDTISYNTANRRRDLSIARKIMYLGFTTRSIDVKDKTEKKTGVTYVGCENCSIATANFGLIKGLIDVLLPA